VLVVGNDPFFTTRSEQLAALALRQAVPAIFQYLERNVLQNPFAAPRKRNYRSRACGTWHAPSSLSPPCQLFLLLRPEHGRIIPLPEANSSYIARGASFARHADGNIAEIERCSAAANNPLFNTLCLDNDAFPQPRTRGRPALFRVGWDGLHLFTGFLPEIFIAHGRGLFSFRAVDNIERLIPFPFQQSNMIEQTIRTWSEPWIAVP
jgi:hypothetical protein